MENGQENQQMNKRMTQQRPKYSSLVRTMDTEFRHPQVEKCHFLEADTTYTAKGEGTEGVGGTEDSGHVFVAKVAQRSRVNKIGQQRNRGGKSIQEHKEPQISRDEVPVESEVSWV